MTIEEKTLQEAFSRAAAELNCSVTELEYKVIQYPSSGFLGLFKKNAIIEVKKENSKLNRKSQKKESLRPRREKRQRQKGKITPEILSQIETKLTTLFSKGCFSISTIKTEKYDDETVLVLIDGDDAALLIGKDGRRYKAILYMIYNWISLKYNLKTRLEISRFLQTQEEMVDKYLQNVIEKVKISGKAATKPLDGILVDIALKQLRAEFPDKYVVVKTGNEGKYVIVNEFKK